MSARARASGRRTNRRAHADDGLVGDRWQPYLEADGRIHRDNQLTIASTRLLALIADPERWPLAGDNLLVDMGLDKESLPAGSRLAIGETVVVEISEEPHTGCAKFSARFGRDALKFINSPEGRELRLRGLNAHVIVPGTISTGDAVRRVWLSRSPAARARARPPENLGVPVDVGLGRRRRHERHVVERGQQDAPVQREEVHVALELAVDRSVRPPRRCAASRPNQYSARQPSRVTCHGRPCSAIRRLDAVRPALGERDHVRERLVGEHLASVARIAASESALRQRPADAADVDVLGSIAASSARRPPRRTRRRRRGCRRRSASHRDHVRLEPVRRVYPPGPRRSCASRRSRATCRSHAVSSRSAAWNPGLGMHDPDVRQRRLGEHERDVAVRELALERVDVVELDDPRRDRRIDRRPEVAAARATTPSVAERRERLVDRAVVAPVEDEDLRPPGEVAGEADREAVGVGRRQRELPARQPNRRVSSSPTQIASSRGQHERDPAARLLAHRLTVGAGA